MDPLKEAIRRLAGPRAAQGNGGLPLQSSTPVPASPACAFGHVVNERLNELDRQLGEVKARINGLIFLVAGAVVVEIVLRLFR